MLLLRSLALVAALLGLAAANPGSQYSQVVGPYLPADLTGQDGSYGESIAITKSGKDIFVGVPQANGGGAVSVLIFNGKAAVEKQRLTPPANSLPLNFGFSVALDPTGKYLAVGDPSSDLVAQEAGAVHIYTKGATKRWTLLQTIAPGGLAAGANFGLSVALSQGGKMLVVGAPGDPTTSDIGAFYVYTLTTTKPRQYTLKQGPVTPAAGLTAGAFFGGDVAMTKNGQYLAAAASLTNNSQGAVYLYKWDKAQGIYAQVGSGPFAAGAVIGDLFGFALAFAPSGKDLAICAGSGNGGQGLLTLASYNSKTQSYQIAQTIAPAAANGYTPEGFCSSLGFAPSGKSLGVGEGGYLNGNEAGAVWVLTKKAATKTGGPWAITAGPITARQPAPGTQLGNRAVALTNGAKHIITSATDYPAGFEDGALYIFKKV